MADINILGCSNFNSGGMFSRRSISVMEYRFLKFLLYRIIGEMYS